MNYYNHGMPRLSKCSLCEEPAVGFGVWVPTRELQKRMGCPKGKTRLLGYGLCGDHAARRKELEPQIEAIFLKELTVM